ncbi:MAG: hypothetical protein K2X86_12255 [Cytophagaceae bacterium]|nr:hypothetical protein [Cytophagaceae bacterium]
MTNQDSLTDLIRIFIRWKKTILIITITAAIGSAVISFLLPKYYKSTVIFYPYNLKGLDPKNILSNEASDVFGTKDDGERMLQMGKSKELATYIIQKFDLYKRYDIDTVDNELKEYEVQEEFEDNYKVIKNDIGAIEITVFDKDPKIAADIANEMVSQINISNKKSIIENNSKLYAIMKDKLDAKFKELELMSNSIKNLQKENINPNGMNQSMLNLNEIDVKLTEKITQSLDIKERYEEVTAMLNTDFNTIFLVEKATPAVKKSKPVRWLIVAASTFLAFFLSVIGILFIEFYKNNISPTLRNEV